MSAILRPGGAYTSSSLTASRQEQRAGSPEDARRVFREGVQSHPLDFKLVQVRRLIASKFTTLPLRPRSAARLTESVFRSSDRFRTLKQTVERQSDILAVMEHDLGNAGRAQYQVCSGCGPTEALSSTDQLRASALAVAPNQSW